MWVKLYQKKLSKSGITSRVIRKKCVSIDVMLHVYIFVCLHFFLVTFHNLCASFHEGLTYFIMVIPIYFIFWTLFKMVLKFIFLFYLLEYKNAIWFLHLINLFNSINLNKLSILFKVSL